MSLDAFAAQGNTQTVALTTSASAGLQSGSKSQGIRFNNQTTAPVYWTASGSSSVTAAFPTTAVPALGVPLLPTSAEVFNVGPGAWLSFLSSAAGGFVLFTGGSGV